MLPRDGTQADTLPLLHYGTVARSGATPRSKVHTDLYDEELVVCSQGSLVVRLRRGRLGLALPIRMRHVEGLHVVRVRGHNLRVPHPDPHQKWARTHVVVMAVVSGKMLV